MPVYSGGQIICGVSIGVLSLDSKFLKPPGNIKNPSSLPFTVLYETVPGANVKKLLTEPDDDFIKPFINAARHLEAVGAGNIPVIVQGMEGYTEFNEVIIEAQRNEMDTDLKAWQTHIRFNKAYHHDSFRSSENPMRRLHATILATLP